MTVIIPYATVAHIIRQGGKGLKQLHNISGTQVSAYTLMSGPHNEHIRKRPFIPGIHLGGPGAFQAIKAIQSIPGCFQSSQSNLGNTLNALAILSKAVKAI